jgi:hypothetical protein
MNCPYCEEPIPSVAVQSESASLYACQGCLNPVVIEWVDNSSVTRPLAHTKDIRHAVRSFRKRLKSYLFCRRFRSVYLR